MRQQHELVQGSDEWHQFRLEHFGASEAAAMLGLSSKVKRSELLRMKHTGIANEFSDWVQDNILDNGHRVEALARPMAEAIIGDELYPATHSDGKLSASCDGLTMDGTIAFEHKQWNEALAAAVRAGELPDEQMPQCQQVSMVTGADKVLFMVSDGTPDKCVHMWVYPDVAWRKRILQGWAQFADDLANYQHVAEPTPVAAAAVTDLPAVAVTVSGAIDIKDNFKAFEVALRDFIDNRLIREPQTDQDFADLDAQIKTLKKAEDALDAAEAHMLAQVSTIDQVKRTKDMLRELTRQNRLMAEKLITAEKQKRRDEIQNAGKAALAAHIASLNALIGKPYMPVIASDFPGVMRAKKTIASLRDAVDTELARCKIEADEVSRRILANMNSLRELAADYVFLFADTAQIVLKQNDDLVALIKARISDHKEAEAKKAEQARIKSGQDAVRAKATAVPAPSLCDVLHAVAPPYIADAIAPLVARQEITGPTDDEMPGDIIVSMHIANITIRDARRIAELLGNGSVVWEWENGRCYPTSDACCTIVRGVKP